MFEILCNPFSNYHYVFKIYIYFQISLIPLTFRTKIELLSNPRISPQIANRMLLRTHYRHLYDVH
jgi:hypothetical protein